MEPIHEKWEEKIDIANDASLLNDLYSKHHETLMNFYLSVAKDYGNTAENNYRKVVEIFVGIFPRFLFSTIYFYKQ